MHDVLRQYQELSPNNSGGASDEELHTLEQVLPVPLPEDVRALYREHNGTKEFGDLPWRFMSIAEVHEWREMMRAYYRDTGDFNWLEHGVTAFWSDDNSNYAGVYLTGLLKGYVCYLNHDEPEDIAPAYHSILSFLQASMDAARQGLGWYEMHNEYPVCDQGLPAEYAEKDGEVVQSLYPLYHAPESLSDITPELAHNERWERAHNAFCIMALTPFEQTPALYRFVQDHDMYIQERACEILGCRRDENAVPLLTKVAVAGTHNGQLAAIRALGLIGTSECLTKLTHLIEELPYGYEAHIANALRGCGCEVTHNKGVWSYRLPKTDEWILITLKQ